MVDAVWVQYALKHNMRISVQCSSITLRSPKSERPIAILPQLDRAILATSSIQLPIWREADTPNWSMMTLVDL
jgi:hypothetical protein